MKCLMYDEIIKIIEDAFQAGYDSGYSSEDSIHVEFFSEYLERALKEIGEA